MPCRGDQQRVRVAEHPARDDPAVAGRPAQAGIALRPGHRDRGAGRRRRPPAAVARGRGAGGRADPGRPAAGGARRPADDDGGPRPRDDLHGGARAAGRGGRAGAGDGGGRGPVAAPGGGAPAGRRDPRGSSRRADGQRLAAVLARREQDRGPRHARCGRHGRRALRGRGRGCRRPPPDAQRPQGSRQDHPGRADPRAAARPHPGGVAGAAAPSTRWPAGCLRAGG